MTTHADIYSLSELHAEREVSLAEYLHRFNDPEETFSLNTAGRLVRAIGEPTVIDTATDERLGRMFSKRVISIYPGFEDLYGLEDTIERLMMFLRMAASGYPQERMLLYMHGLPSSGKSSLAERLLKCYERVPVWTLAVKVPSKEGGEETERTEISPIFEHPLGLFDANEHGAHLENRHKIPRSRLQTGMSPWAAYHLRRLKTRSGFFVKKVLPWSAAGTCIASADFGANKDSSFLIGHQGREFKRRQYMYSGAFNRTTQGLLELVEIFKADPKLLLSLLTATQDRWYVGAGGIGRLPYQGLPIAYSNTDDWKLFQKLPAVSAMRSRIFEVAVPLPTSVSAEVKILRTVIDTSDGRDMSIVPGSLDIAAVFSVTSRLEKKGRGVRMRMYDGQHPGDLKEADLLNVTADDLRKMANHMEGLEEGILIRQMQKWLPQLVHGGGLDPVMVVKRLYEITQRECREALRLDGTSASDLIEQYCTQEAARAVSLIVRRAYPDDHNLYLRSHFGRYFTMLDHWIENLDWRDPESDEIYKNDDQEREMRKLEQPAGVASPKDFRAYVWPKVLPHKEDFLKPGGIPWRDLEPDLWRRVEEVLLPDRATLLPSEAQMEDEKGLFSIAYGPRDTKEERDRHAAYVGRVIKLCTNPAEHTKCTPDQARRMIEWFIAGCTFKALIQ